MAEIANFPGGLFRVGKVYQDANGKEVPEDKLPKELRSKKDQGTEDPDGTDLAKDFPGRADLLKAGVITMAAVKEMTLEQLVALPGVGEATARKILDAAKA